MISVTLSSLESARNHPAAFGQLLAKRSKGGGTKGFMECFRNAALQVHTGELTLPQGKLLLMDDFRGFKNTTANLRRQELLVERFPSYMKLFNSEELQFKASKSLLRVSLHPDVQ